MEEKSVRLTVKGKVQGVYFRASTREVATKLGISGWVKNLPSGEVQIEAEGQAANLDSFVNWCRRGPMRAEVTQVTIEDIPLKGLQDFKVEYN